ncbi:MAG TPA: PD-(D/E)XK nuclease family protein, partial [Acetobacteraceae bacterium]|nr:PD-(D/E)XK nuclease family protein [Acetobacteraceae bacterium]
RVLIWGLLEARLQAVDVVVLGGLTEGVWPEIPEPGPWMSRAMRMTVGLPAPEEKVGQAAHDFVMAACSAPVAVLSVPGRRDGAPAVPARWVTRLEALLAGQGRTLPEHPATLWARALDRPVGAPAPVSPPAPCPPVAARPRRLSVTAIETWLRDPYAIYARHVLGLEALRPLEESADHLDYGTIVHAAICAFLGDLPPHWPEDAADRMRAAMAAALGSAVLRPALAAWWRPRLARIADWVAAAEQERRAHGPLAHLGAEVKGQHVFDGPAGPFRLVGRADRIERRFDSSIAILDYKTGSPPSNKDVAAGRAPQLTLEAFMAEAGAFGEELTGTVTELVYWHLTGGFEPGKARALFRNARNDKTREAEKQKVAELTAAAGEKLARLIARFDDPGQPYLSQPNPAAPPRFSDYAQLARVGEWAVVDDAADDPAGEDAPEDEA